MDVLLLVILALYLIPTIIAMIRKHPHTLGILILNIALGWTFLGFIVALIWACVKPQMQPISQPEPDPLPEKYNQDAIRIGRKNEKSKSTVLSRSALYISAFLISFALLITLANEDQDPTENADIGVLELRDSHVAELSSGETKRVSAQTLNVRMCPSTNCEIVEQLRYGDEVMLSSTSDNWSNVGSNESPKWVSSRYLTDTVSSSEDNIESSKTRLTNTKGITINERQRAPNTSVETRTVGSYSQCRNIADTLVANVYSEIIVDSNVAYMRKYLTGDGEVLVTCSMLDRKIVVTQTKY